MKNKTKQQPVTKKFYEVHTSENGENWFGTSGKYDPTPEGVAQAKKHAYATSHSRHVRVVEITRTAKVVLQKENTNVLSRQELDELLSKGKAAVAGIPGVSVNEGFLIGFGTSSISHSPTRVTVTFNAASVLGKCPPRGRDPQLNKEWNEKATALQTQTLNLCAAKLQEAGIWTTHNGHEIILRPTGK